MSHSSFDDYAEQYEHACNKGLALAGEPADYFADGRIAYTATWLAAAGALGLKRIADFGCGIGNSTPYFRKYFPGAEVLGLDTSSTSIKRAQQHYGDSAKFELFGQHTAARDRQLVYCNGVFHHIEPAERREWAARIRGLLAPGGYFALWENNPRNPGAMMVMRRIPFDRDAIPLDSREARSLLVDAGFNVLGTRYRFYFPRGLSRLRSLERYGERIPLGAQYCVLARNPLSAT